jgi:hypothetical protein
MLIHSYGGLKAAHAAKILFELGPLENTILVQAKQHKLLRSFSTDFFLNLDQFSSLRDVLRDGLDTMAGEEITWSPLSGPVVIKHLRVSINSLLLFRTFERAKLVSFLQD